MDKKPEGQPTGGCRHIVYDRQTGRVVLTHTRYSVLEEQQVRAPDEEVLALVDDRSLQRAGCKLDDLAVVVTSDPRIAGGWRVDPKTHEALPKPTITVAASEREIEGNGKDAATIAVEVREPSGQVDKSFNGQLKLTTSRGKLSARRGLVDIKNGTGTITLTSVAETVASVVVRATCPGGTCQSGATELEFT